LKRLVVNADDFGFTPDVNEGIVDAHRNGILTSTTLMANGDAFEDAVRLAASTPSLDIGCHLALIGGRSLLAPYKPLPASVPDLLRAILLRQLPIYDELAAQVRKIQAAGIAPTHLDTHKHTHLAPPVLDVVARLSQQFEIPWVRRPFDLPITAASGGAPFLKRATSGMLETLRGRFHRVLSKRGCRTTDHFAGFQLTGRFRTRELVQLIQALPDGSTELMCHPGRCGAALRNAATRLKESREEELLALISPEARQALARAHVRLVNYRELGEVGPGEVR
jgi:predicted glycoside hydrolase/deacetylase ChbG (UPF0249 family)